MTNAYDAGWGPIGVVSSPVFGILETLSGFPGLDQTQLNNWLYDTPMFREARNFRDDQPGAAFATDIVSSFIPYIGWGGALNRAGQAANALGAVNRAGAAAARFAGPNVPLAFALGETVRYAPASAAITAFDVLGGRYNSPVEAAVGFGIGNLLGIGGQAAGHALSPLVQRFAPAGVGGAWKAFFEPGPQLSALYGFDTNVQRAAGLAATDEEIQDALAPMLAPQMRARAIWEILHEPDQTHPPEVLDLLRQQYDFERRTILSRELDPTEEGFRPPPDTPADVRRIFDTLVRNAATANGNRVRVPITGDGHRWENPDVLAANLGLPETWVHEVDLPGIVQVGTRQPEALNFFRKSVGLEPGFGAPNGIRRLERDGPMGRQTWSIAQDESGMYLLTTELPVIPGINKGDIHRMTGRARYDNTRSMDKAEPAKWFFSFKTHNPSAFFPTMRAEFDAVDEGLIGRFESRIPRGMSKTLDRALDFQDIYLNPNTLRAAQAATYASPEQKAKFIKALLSGPTAGKEIAQLVETYMMPTQFQLRKAPKARAVLSMYQALFDAAEGRARSVLHGTASIPEGKSAIYSLFHANVDETEALAAGLRKLAIEDPTALELIRRAVFEPKFPLESIEGTPVGQWLKKAVELNLVDINDGNSALEALSRTGARTSKQVPKRKNHIGVSRRWDGTVYVPIYTEGSVNPVAARAGNSLAQAQRKANDWIAHFGPKEGKTYRTGTPFIPGETKEVPKWARMFTSEPGFLKPQTGLRGYEYEYESFKHVDDLIALLEDGLVGRQRYFAGAIADAMMTGKLNELRAQDPKAWKIVDTRIAQLKGQPGPIDARLNQITDSVLARVMGTNSFTRIVDSVNGLMFQLLHGMGNIATPALNMTSVMQTQLPTAVNLITSDLDVLRGQGFQFPVIGGNGKPTRGFNWVADPIGLMGGGIRKAASPSPEDQEVFNALFNRKIMGTGLANEYTGQDRTIARRWSEGIRESSDVGYWAEYVSSALMSKTEQVSRTIAAGMALKSMDMLEASHGFKFTMDQRIANAARFVEMTNFGYFQADRPMMYTTPLGALFGNQKTWVTNYLFLMAEYFGLAQRGNAAPLLMTLGATTMLGGVFAVPLAGSAIDMLTETFADQDATEYMYRNLGEGGNAISFGLPALFGMSLQGNVAAPGSNLAHDTEFFFTIVALERAKLMGRAIGRAWDDQVMLGMNPLRDRVFQQQALQAFAPRSLYRTWEAVTSDTLRSAATGYPMVQDMSPAARVMHAMGFREADIAIRYAAYERLLKDKEGMQRRISGFGEQYALAMANGDQDAMAAVLQQVSASGVDINRVMMSAQVRLRNMGLDMFGRNFNQEQLDRYQATLEAGGVQ